MGGGREERGKGREEEEGKGERRERGEEGERRGLNLGIDLL